VPVILFTFSDPNSCCTGGFGVFTDSSGNYSINVAAASYKVRFSKAGFVSQWYNGTAGGSPGPDSTTVLVVNADRTGINATLLAGFIISGHVQDASNAALSGVNVTVNTYDLGDPNSCCISGIGAL